MITEKPKKLQNKYRLVTNCIKCGRHINIELIIDIQEQPEYGRPKKVEYDILPTYITECLRAAQSNLNLNKTNANPKIQSLCDTCLKISKLKE